MNPVPFRRRSLAFLESVVLGARLIAVGGRRRARTRAAATLAGRRWLARIPRDAEAAAIRLASSPRDTWPALFARTSADAFRTEFPEVAAAILGEAHQVRQRRPVVFGTRIAASEPGEGLLPWHRDTVSQHRWPATVAGLLLAPIAGSEIKRPWELSRFQHLLPSALAYWLTGDDSHVAEIRAQLEDWSAHNAFGLGVNWQCSMEVGLRAISWLYLLDTSFDSPALARDVKIGWLRSLYQHGRFIHQLPETSARVAGDHYIADYASLFVLGVLFRDTREGQIWIADALRILGDDVGDQLDADGVYRGGAVVYGALIAELYLLVIGVASRNGIAVPPALASGAHELVAFTLACTPASGRLPLIGDSDDARVLPLDPTAHRCDRRFLGALAAQDGSAPLLGTVRTAEAALWGAPRVEAPAIETGTSCPDVGFYLLRSPHLFAFVDGYRTFPRAPNGHRHESRLSLVLSDECGELLVDPGVVSYTVDANTAVRFREAAAHNVLLPCGGAQTVGSTASRIGREGHVELIRYRTSAEAETVKLTFDGYREIFGVVWTRTVHLDRARELVLVLDCLDGRPGVPFEIYWHVAPGSVHANGNVAELRDRSTPRMLLVGLDGAAAAWRVEASEIAVSYGVRAPAPVVVRDGVSSSSTAFITAVVPLRGQPGAERLQAARDALIDFEHGAHD